MHGLMSEQPFRLYQTQGGSSTLSTTGSCMASIRAAYSSKIFTISSTPSHERIMSGTVGRSVDRSFHQKLTGVGLWYDRTEEDH